MHWSQNYKKLLHEIHVLIYLSTEIKKDIIFHRTKDRRNFFKYIIEEVNV